MEKGSTLLRTVTDRKTSMAVATLKEPLEHTLSIYDLNEFLSVISFFKDDYNIEPEGNDLIITSSDSDISIRYIMTPPELIQTTTADSIPIDNVIVEFDLSATLLEKLKKAAGIMALPDMRVTNIKSGDIDSMSPDADKGQIYIKVNRTGPSNSNNATVAVGKSPDLDLFFEFGLKNKLLQMMPNDYHVTIGDMTANNQTIYVIKFEAENIVYYIALEKGAITQ